MSTDNYTLVGDSSGTGHSGYLVRVFNGAGGSGAEWGNATSDASGNTVFYLVDGAYGCPVEKSGATGSIIGFSIAVPNPSANDQTFTDTPAQITVHVQKSGGAAQSSYLVRIFNGTASNGSQWGAATTKANGKAVFYLVDSGYQYQVEKGSYNSGRQPSGGFQVRPSTNATYTQVVP